MSGATRIESLCVYPRCRIHSKLGSMFTMIEHMAQHFRDETRQYDHGIGRCRQCHAVFTDVIFVSVHGCPKNFIEIFENRTSSNDQKAVRDASIKFHAFVYQYLIMVPQTKPEVFNRQMELIDQYKAQIHPNNGSSTPRYNPSTPISSPTASFAFREASPAPSPNRSRSYMPRPASRPSSPAARPSSPARPRSPTARPRSPARPQSPTCFKSHIPCSPPKKPCRPPTRPRSPAMTKFSAPTETRHHADRTINTSKSDQSFTLKRPAGEKDAASKENANYDHSTNNVRRGSTVVELRNNSRLGGLIADAPDPCVRSKSPARPARSNNDILSSIQYMMSGIDGIRPKSILQESTTTSAVSSKKISVTSRDDGEMDMGSTDDENDQIGRSFMSSTTAASNAPTAATEIPRPHPYIPPPNPAGCQFMMPPTGVPPPPTFHSSMPYGWQYPHPGMPPPYRPPQSSDASFYSGFGPSTGANNYTPASSIFSDSFETSSSRGERSPPSSKRNFTHAENFMSTRGDYRGRGRGGFRGSGDRGRGRGGFNRNYSDRHDGNTDNSNHGFGGRRDERESHGRRSRSPRGRDRSYSRSPKSDDDGSNKRERRSPPRTSASRRSPPSASKENGRSRRERSSPNQRDDRRHIKSRERSPPRGSSRSEKSRRDRERSYSHSGDSD